ncbi:MAG: sugar phosphate nucleotidyltransferase, partial [Gaiellaceae bacterium]
MKAVVMAGGEGTRLRPLTSNQPKPMVPVVGKPCMEHILELLREHGMTDVIVTVAFLPQAIRSYFGQGESLGMQIGYSVEESPLGTAGSVRLAAKQLDETFLVISGDALCDVDLSKLVAFHKEKGAAVTIGLKSVDNPLEFGIVVTDEDGRIERFLEKPSWGQVFSDTINTGVYVIEPELLDRIPEGEPYDFSKQLFPELLAEGAPLYGFVVPEHRYWKDIGTIEQFREANQDVLDGLVGVDVPGVRLKENIWLGEGVTLPSVDVIEGPAFLGAYTTVEDGARVGPYAVLGANVTVKAGASVQRSVIDGCTHIGTSATVRGATVGRNCDLRTRVRVDEGAALGDECVVGEEALIGPEVRVYPYKTIEAGAQIRQNLVWESRGVRSLFSRDGVVGTINVDVTPEVAVRLGMAFGTQLERGATVVVARDGHPAARMITRAMISGLVSTGVHVADLRIAWPALVRHHV